MTWDGTRPHPDPEVEQKLAKHEHNQNACFRFDVGDKVWIRDRSTRGGYRIVPATVRERHYHIGRAPYYPLGEGYAFNDCRVEGELPESEQNDTYWDCYPGMRVFATREEALEARMTDAFALKMHNAACRRLRELEAAA